MATPHMAGAAALVRSYVKDTLGVTDAQEIRDLTENLMMSTAVPAINSAGAEFSPREQGAGLVNVKMPSPPRLTSPPLRTPTASPAPRRSWAPMAPATSPSPSR